MFLKYFEQVKNTTSVLAFARYIYSANNWGVSVWDIRSTKWDGHSLCSLLCTNLDKNWVTELKLNLETWSLKLIQSPHRLPPPLTPSLRPTDIDMILHFRVLRTFPQMVIHCSQIIDSEGFPNIKQVGECIPSIKQFTLIVMKCSF